MRGYAPTNDPGRSPRGADPSSYQEAHLKLRDTFRQICRQAVRQVPARTALVTTLDANAHLPPHLPWAGHAGARCGAP
eukprot:4515520-Pyramimonas_sp.AAC.1